MQICKSIFTFHNAPRRQWRRRKQRTVENNAGQRSGMLQILQRGVAILLTKAFEGTRMLPNTCVVHMSMSIGKQAPSVDKTRPPPLPHVSVTDNV